MIKIDGIIGINNILRLLTICMPIFLVAESLEATFLSLHCDGDEENSIEIPIESARLSKTLSCFLEDIGSEDIVGQVVPLPFRFETISAVVALLNQLREKNETSSPTFEELKDIINNSFDEKIVVDDLVDLFFAADYLDIADVSRASVSLLTNLISSMHESQENFIASLQALLLEVLENSSDLYELLKNELLAFVISYPPYGREPSKTPSESHYGFEKMIPVENKIYVVESDKIVVLESFDYSQKNIIEIPDCSSVRSIFIENDLLYMLYYKRDKGNGGTNVIAIFDLTKDLSIAWAQLELSLSLLYASEILAVNGSLYIEFIEPDCTFGAKPFLKFYDPQEKRLYDLVFRVNDMVKTKNKLYVSSHKSLKIIDSATWKPEAELFQDLSITSMTTMDDRLYVQFTTNNSPTTKGFAIIKEDGSFIQKKTNFKVSEWLAATESYIFFLSYNGYLSVVDAESLHLIVADKFICQNPKGMVATTDKEKGRCRIHILTRKGVMVGIDLPVFVAPYKS